MPVLVRREPQPRQQDSSIWRMLLGSQETPSAVPSAAVSLQRPRGRCRRETRFPASVRAHRPAPQRREVCRIGRDGHELSEGLPVPRSRRMTGHRSALADWSTQAGCRSAGGIRVSEAQDGRNERPALGAWAAPSHENALTRPWRRPCRDRDSSSGRCTSSSAGTRGAAGQQRRSRRAAGSSIR